jgi:hypothetical protein
VEPTVTVTPTVEATVTPAVGAAGDVGAQAIPGSWTSEIIAIQNLGTSEANVDLSLYPVDDPNPSNPIPATIPIDGNVTIHISSLPDVANGQYAGIISSDEPVAAAVLNTNYSSKLGDMYIGFNSTSNRQILPLIERNHSFWTSTFYIQNASASAQDVTVYAYIVNSPTPSATVPYNIPANTTKVVDFAHSDFNDFGSGLGHFGYAIIEGTGDLAVVCDNRKDQANFYGEAIYDAIDGTQGARTLTAPLFHNSFFSGQWQSGVQVVNLDPVATTLYYTYTLGSPFGGASYYRQVTLDGSAMDSYYPPVFPVGERPPDGVWGALTVSSSNADIAGVLSHAIYRDGALGTTVSLLDTQRATYKVAVPLTFNYPILDGWATGLNVYSVGTPGDITTTWVRANADPATNSFTYSLPGTANAMTSFYAPTIPGMLSNFDGAVYVESTEPILAYFNATHYAQSILVTTIGHNY